MTDEDHRARDGSPDLVDFGPVLTPDEVAQILRLNQQHLVRLMRQGKFPAFKVAGAWRVRSMGAGGRVRRRQHRAGRPGPVIPRRVRVLRPGG